MKALFVVEPYIIDPLGIAYLSSYLKAAGHSVGIYSPGKPTDGLAADMLCYSITTGKHIKYMEINKRMKKIFPDAISVFGGSHVTFFPEFANADGVDVAVAGEGFDAIVDVANAVERGDGFSHIDNVVHDGKFTLRPMRDKATLLHPDRELIYSNPRNYNNPIKNVMCSWLCVFNCPYCYNGQYKKLYNIRRAVIRPVADIMEEIVELQRYPLQLLFFQDDIFPLYDHRWLDRFCEEYASLHIPFHIQTRVEYINESVIKQLKEVGLHGVTFAIESGNTTLRNEVLRRRMSDATIIASADILHKHGINLRTENMIGIPHETPKTAMQTLKLNVACKPTIAWASVFQPYPGTDLGDMCLEEGLFDGDIDSFSESFFETYRLKVKHGKYYVRLQHLFSLAASSRLVRFLLPILLKLSLTKLYKIVYNRTKKRLYGRLYKVG